MVFQKDITTADRFQTDKQFCTKPIDDKKITAAMVAQGIAKHFKEDEICHLRVSNFRSLEKRTRNGIRVHHELTGIIDISFADSGFFMKSFCRTGLQPIHTTRNTTQAPQPVASLLKKNQHGQSWYTQ